MPEGKFIKMPNYQEGNLFVKRGDGVPEEEFAEAISVWEKGIQNKEGVIFQKMLEHKVELNAQQKEVLQLVMEKVKNILAENGLERISVSEEAVHFVDDKFFENVLKYSDEHGGVQLSNLQSVVVRLNESTTNSKLAAVALHELLHLISFQKFRYLKDKWHKDLENYFQEINGLSINERKNPEIQYFHFLTEAVVEKMTDDFMLENKNNPLFEKDYAIIDKYFAERKDAGFLVIKKNEKGQNIYGRSSAYRKEVEKLDALIEEICQKNKKEFTSEDDVFTVFKKALFSGRILPLARLIEKTRGKGAFTKLALETKEDQPYFTKI